MSQNSQDAKRKLRVMIVEDEDHVRRLLKSLMVSMNCDIAGEAGNGQDAVEMYRRLKPHILLLDINMPLKSGKKALSEIKSQFPHAFVIMITSLSDRETIEDCIKLGATGFIRKDLPTDEIKDVIKTTWRAYLEAIRR